MAVNGKYRAISWWLTWKDLAWPDDDIADDIRRRADMAAETGVNCAVIFGAHFRWDFMPLWMNLHDMLAFVGTELHQRGIMLFDHHSAVLTHRYSTHEEALEMRLRNRHHVPFAPSRDIASEWTYKGKKLDDWRMIDLTTGKPVFLKKYMAEQFCMNNPDFRTAYYGYVQRLLKETGIDGLMPDDGVFFSGWTSCGCEWCRKKFRENYGHEVPPVSDTSFWGNHESEAFKDWIEMRFRTTGEFLEGVRNVTGNNFPLMTCCANSISKVVPGYGLTYQEFIKPCNHIMLEMCGNTPSMDGTWHRYFPEQMLHVGIGLENNAPCLALGYGFTEATADFIWAFSKFLGSDTWFSTLKGRLGLPDSKMLSLKDDTELCGNGFNWEKNHPEIFNAETDTEIAVFFSRWSRDFYGMTEKDYTFDYIETCFELLRNNITFDVVAAIPEASKYKVLLLSSASCLDEMEYASLNKYLKDGGVIIASGPTGVYDKRANSAVKPWLGQFGIKCEICEPERIASFPPWSMQDDIVPACSGIFGGAEVALSGWVEISSGKGKLSWSPGRMQNSAKDLAIPDRIRDLTSEKVSFDGNAGWRFRVFKKGSTRIIHVLAERFNIACIDELEEERKCNRGNNLINSVRKSYNTPSTVKMGIKWNCKSADFYAPLKGLQKQIPVENGKLEIAVEDEIGYFIIKLTGE